MEQSSPQDVEATFFRNFDNGLAFATAALADLEEVFPFSGASEGKVPTIQELVFLRLKRRSFGFADLLKEQFAALFIDTQWLQLLYSPRHESLRLRLAALFAQDGAVLIPDLETQVYAVKQICIATALYTEVPPDIAVGELDHLALFRIPLTRLRFEQTVDGLLRGLGPDQRYPAS